MIVKNCRRCGREQSSPTLRYHFSMSGESEENHKKLQSRQFMGQELNPGSEYDTGQLITGLCCSLYNTAPPPLFFYLGRMQQGLAVDLGSVKVQLNEGVGTN
jgi:hypothetical protein